MKIGFIGVGVMGSPMAENILDGGYELYVHDTDSDALQNLVQRGAGSGENPKEIASIVDVVITMLPLPSDVETVVFASDGVVEAARKGLIFVDMSTGSPVLAKKIAIKLGDYGVKVIDCPVGGGEPQAIEGSLVLIAGGDKSVLEKIRPMLMCMGNKLVYCGGPGTGQAMKLTNNMLGAVSFQATAEALSLGMKFGIKLETMLDVLSSTAAGNTLITKILPGKTFKGDYKPGFSIRLAKKDVGLALDLAKELDVPVPLASFTSQRIATLIASGYGDLDIGAIIKAQADLLKLEMRTDT